MKRHWAFFTIATMALFLVAACAAEDAGPAPTAIAPQAAATAVPAADPAAAADPAKPLAPQGAVDPAKPVGIQPAGVPTLTPEEAAPGLFSFDPTGLAVPTSFSESPILAAKVAKGELPPVEQRMPKNPFVHKTVDRIGEYGGTLRRAFSSPRDGQNYDRISHDQFTLLDLDGVGSYPYMAESVDIVDDKVYTMFLREGLRWSDGEPLTADDLVFAHEEITYNDVLRPGRGKKLGYGSFAPRFEKVGDFTVRWTFDEPTPAFEMASWRTLGGWNVHSRTGNATYAPAHIAKQFHPDFAGLDTVMKMAGDEGFDDWPSFFKNRLDANRNTDVPTVSPWLLTSPITSELFERERNPYFFAVDEAGNQLPYIDKISIELVEDGEILNLKGIAGEFDFQGRHVLLGKLPVYLQNEDRGGYHMVIRRGKVFHQGIAFNQNWEGDDELEKWVRNRDFRLAWSLAVNREEIKEVLNLGLGDVGWAVAPEGHAFYMGPEWEFKNAPPTPDVDAANKLLDDIGLDRKTSDGYRIRTDGSGKVLQFDCNVPSPYVGVDTEGFVELVESHMAEVGIKVVPKPVSRALWQGLLSGDEILVNCLSSYAPNYADGLPLNVAVPTWGPGSKWGKYMSTDGAEGIEPPAEVKRLNELYESALKVAKADRGPMIIESYQISINNMWGFNTVKNAPGYANVVIVKNNIMNFVEDSQNFNQWPGEIHLDQMFFVGGKNDAGF
jgi:peptide/nickel transport system substrate-binding protein